MALQQLSMNDVTSVSGAGIFGDISAGLWAASAVSGGLACVPTPASGALAAFTVMAGVMAAGAAYLDTNYQ
ncbi:MAG: hypothetical protein H7203_10150 [Rhizobacter sp.]|nr:hypothetical protein [Burkholderiales bacterium]